MAKRANGEGNIRKRTDGKWLVTFPTGLYKENGKREYVYQYYDSQAEAAEALRQLQSEKAMGVCHSKSAIKTGEWIDTWIEKHKAPKLAPANYANLILVTPDVHQLIHAKAEETVQKYLNKLKSCKLNMARLNRLRELAGNCKIANR